MSKIILFLLEKLIIFVLSKTMFFSLFKIMPFNPILLQFFIVSKPIVGRSALKS